MFVETCNDCDGTTIFAVAHSIGQVQQIGDTKESHMCLIIVTVFRLKCETPSKAANTVVGSSSRCPWNYFHRDFVSPNVESS
jgi:hypothetical protein